MPRRRRRVDATGQKRAGGHGAEGFVGRAANLRLAAFRGNPEAREARIGTPMGYAEFPKEILHPPRSLAERVYANIQRWTMMEKGGHFAALEQPEALAREIRAFFRPLR